MKVIDTSTDSLRFYNLGSKWHGRVEHIGVKEGYDPEQSYTDISLKVKQNEKLQQIIELESISTSQLSRKWRDMDPAFLESVFRDLVRKLFQRLGMSKAARRLSG